MRFLFVVFIIFFPISSLASITIDAQIVRNQPGSGTCLISSGFPFPPGLVTEQMIKNGTIKVIVNGSEVAANISALRGRHSDGSLRAALIQFTEIMHQGDVLKAQLIVDAQERAFPDPKYIRPTFTIVANNNVILPTDPAYITTTRITWRGLLPAGSGTPMEEKQYTALANDRFDALVAKPNLGTARYEEVDGMLSMWARTGDKKYFNQAVSYALDRLSYYTPSAAAIPMCKAATHVNPDKRSIDDNHACGLPAEWHSPMMLSFASMYLLTGYRDFWSVVAYNVQYEQSNITNQEIANTRIIKYSKYDYPRFNYSQRYGALIASALIDATYPVPGQYFTPRKLKFSDQFNWTLNAIISSQWNIKWIPFSKGSGVVPDVNTNIQQTGVSARLLGVYKTKNDPQVTVGTVMPQHGFLMVDNISGGDFSIGALSGISAHATGKSIDDYRNGMTGTLSNSPRDVNIPVFQLVFVSNFLIDYYLNINTDPRIPELIKKNLDIILKQMKPIQPGDPYFGVNGGSWGNPFYEKPYSLENPPASDTLAPYELPEYARIIAFALKTSGNDTVNGASYSTWYNRFINTANNSPIGVLIWQWKLFGQFYGWGADAPWIMAQKSLPKANFREPTFYSDIPRDTPEIQRAP